jgi:hypothetical protein
MTSAPRDANEGVPALQGRQGEAELDVPGLRRLVLRAPVRAQEPVRRRRGWQDHRARMVLGVPAAKKMIVLCNF